MQTSRSAGSPHAGLLDRRRCTRPAPLLTVAQRQAQRHAQVALINMTGHLSFGSKEVRGSGAPPWRCRRFPRKWPCSRADRQELCPARSGHLDDGCEYAAADAASGSEAAPGKQWAECAYTGRVCIYTQLAVIPQTGDITLRPLRPHSGGLRQRYASAPRRRV